MMHGPFESTTTTSYQTPTHSCATLEGVEKPQNSICCYYFCFDDGGFDWFSVLFIESTHAIP